MRTSSGKTRLVSVGIAAALAMLAGCAGNQQGMSREGSQGVNQGANQGMRGGMDHGMHLDLTGANEVPPVATQASGMGMIMVGTDRSISGKVMAKGMDGTMAHIHQAAAGQNGAVIITLEKSGGQWLVPSGAILTEAQYAAYKEGNLYVNVHTEANKGGEVRAQLRP